MKKFAPQENRFDRTRYDDEGNKYCWCNLCKQFLPEKKFGKNKNSKNGRNFTCQLCCRKEMDIIPIGDTQEFIKAQTRIILSNMGYDINNNIAAQFEQRNSYRLKK